ncbi:MAG: DUF4956 domain-containing protein [Eubacteriales bacterium]|nr:DUF4956 domain-containing protein [Eubacteriales bacterium]
MNFGDIFKKSFLEGFYSTDLQLPSILLSLMVTCLLACYIFLAYRLLTRKTFYNKSFGVSLAALAIITAAVILTIQSNIVISLGMVGALSIVRFRTAVKEPMDLVFLFWAISVGIICGANLYSLAVVSCLVVTVAIFLLDLVPVTKAPMLLVTNGTDIDGEAGILSVVEKYSRFCRVKSRTVAAGQLDLVIEVRVDEAAALVKEVGALKGMESVSLLSHDGETTY